MDQLFRGHFVQKLNICQLASYSSNQLRSSIHKIIFYHPLEALVFRDSFAPGSFVSGTSYLAYSEFGFHYEEE